MGIIQDNPLRRVNTDFVKIYLHHNHMELKEKKKRNINHIRNIIKDIS